MSNFLERLNEQRSNTLLDQERIVLEQTSVDVDFHKAFQDGEIISVYFEMADVDGNLYAMANGYTICLPFSIIGEKVDGFKARMKNRLLRHPLAVKVKSIDEEEKCIYVSLETSISVDGSTPEERAQRERVFAGRLNREIRNSLKVYTEDTTGTIERPKVVGTILMVSEKFAMVSLYGTPVVGRISVQEWASCYLRSLKSVCGKGETFVFEVIDEKPRLDKESQPRGNEVMWELSRMGITPDPWSEDNLKRVTVDSVIRVSGIDFPEGKDYFWGTSRMCPGIEILCNRRDEKLPMKMGITYNARVKKLDIENHTLVVTPFEVSEESVRIAALLKDVMGKGRNKKSSQ